MAKLSKVFSVLAISSAMLLFCMQSQSTCRFETITATSDSKGSHPTLRGYRSVEVYVRQRYG